MTDKDTPTSPLMALKSVTRTFKDGNQKIQAINDVSLDIHKGEFISLSGPSGSGKTTLLNLIGGLDQPTSGTIQIEGTHLDQLTTNQLTELRLHEIGFIFQAYNLIPVFSAIENVEFIMQMQGVSRETSKQKSLDILKLVGLEGLENRKPSELSGGQQQRVAVARAIVAQPKIVLADEPTANLDSSNSIALINLMKELNQMHDMTFIISSHDPEVIKAAPRKIVMMDGKISEDGCI